MIFSCLSPDEIIWKYKKADDKKNIIKILCELTCSSEREMKIFLGTGRAEEDLSGKIQYKKLDEKEAFKLWKKGMFDPEIAEILGSHRNTVRNWRRRNGLETNFGKKRGKNNEKKN